MVDTATPQQRPAGDRPPLLTFQNVTLLVFAGLAATIVAISVASLLVHNPPDDSFLFTRTLTGLVIAALVCALLAWLDQANTQLLGSGVRQLLSIHRAAIAAFIAAAVVTIGVCLLVALAALFSGRVQHGLYILAAIQFLLKLAAVSAIIVLITVRRAPVLITRPATGPTAAGTETAVAEDPDDRGRLEFGSLAFAFGLIVIAGLVMPNEDLMRLSAMFFGGEKKIEDYLPRQPILAVDDDLGELIATSVNASPAVQNVMEKIGESERQIISNSIRVAVKSVMYDAAIDNAQRTGTFEIFQRICDGTQEDIIFANSTNRVLSEHLTYLVGEGLIKIVYDDLTSVRVTDYGNDVMYKYAGTNCVGHEEELDGISDTARMLTAGSSIVISIESTPKSFGLDLPPGTYYAALVAQDDSDPVLQLLDREGTLLQEDDDSGTGRFDALIYFTVDSPDQGLVLRAKTFDDFPGNAELHIENSEEPLPQAANLRGSADTTEVFSDTMTAEELVRTLPPIDVGSSGLTSGIAVPAGGTAISFRAPQSGDYAVGVEAAGANAAYDLIATLFQMSGDTPTLIAFDDDSGRDNLPAISAPLTAGESYYLVLQHYGVAARPAIVDVHFSPLPTRSAPEPPAPAAEQPALSDDEDGLQGSPDQTGLSAPAPAETPAAEVPAAEPGPAAEPSPTGSGGSQSDP